jgi:hypothetical protein
MFLSEEQETLFENHVMIVFPEAQDLLTDQCRLQVGRPFPKCLDSGVKESSRKMRA